MSSHVPWWQPLSARIEVVPGEAVEPVTLFAIGSDIEPFMSPPEVTALKVRFQELFFRLELSAFISERLYELHLRESLKDSDQSPEEIVREVIKMGTMHYVSMIEIAESAEWPAGYSPPEFYELARQEMEAGVNNG